MFHIHCCIVLIRKQCLASKTPLYTPLGVSHSPMLPSLSDAFPLAVDRGRRTTSRSLLCWMLVNIRMYVQCENIICIHMYWDMALKILPKVVRRHILIYPDDSQWMEWMYNGCQCVVKGVLTPPKCQRGVNDDASLQLQSAAFKAVWGEGAAHGCGMHFAWGKLDLLNHTEPMVGIVDNVDMH
jgi:hypothetical protein